MPWNQPGSGGNKDPWGGGGGRQSPPDLDDIVKNVQKSLGGLLGGKRGGGGGDKSSFGGSGVPNKVGLLIGVLAVIGFWAWQSVYTVQQGVVGVELRFGAYSQTTQAGLQWAWWPIEEVIMVNVQKVNTVEVGYRTTGNNRQSSTVPREALMLTADENIVDLELAVQYNVKEPTDLIFNVAENSETIIRGATESALREVVGTSKMDFVLTDGRPEVARATKALLQLILDRYQTGINILAVEMQDAQPPKEVKPAFDDAVKAREDQVRLINEAEAYANDIIPRARGRAARLLPQAAAYQASVIARAIGEASRFTQVLAEYQNAPDITRERLYLESIEEVLTNSSKLMIDQQGGNNVIYLPLDQLMRQRRLDSTTSSSNGGVDFSDDIAGTSGQDSRNRSGLRDRGN
jgi:membrane protease subunit HflK